MQPEAGRVKVGIRLGVKVAVAVGVGVVKKFERPVPALHANPAIIKNTHKYIGNTFLFFIVFLPR
jgi:hypothetical protein